MVIRTLVVFGLASAAAAAVPSQATSIVGLWGSERSFGPRVRGELVVDGRTAPWQASIDGYVLGVHRDGSAMDFHLPGDAGAFRGRIAADGSIRGFWVQPETTFSGAPYASPVTLRRETQPVWQGRVRPLPDELSLYLDVTVADDASLHAFIRNPEENLGMGRPFVVKLDGSRVRLVDADDPHDVIDGSYDPKTVTLSLTTPDFGPFVFTRRDAGSAPGFFARTPPIEGWTYRQPLSLGDGWPTASLASVGIDAAPIGELVDSILTQKTTSFLTPYIQSLLISRHGKLVLDEYFYGFDPFRTHDMRSASKTFTGLMVGIALEHGARFSLDSPVVPLFPQYRSFANPDPRKDRITVEDLLTMTSGLACDDNDDTSPGNEDRMYAQTAQTDYYKYALDVPMAAEPGSSRAVYCTIGINLLGGILRNTMHEPLVDLFDRYIAQPLQFGEYHIDLTPEGDAYMGGGLYLRPRDALKLGQLYLNGGIWNGRRVVAASWVALSTRRHSSFPSSPFTASHEYGFAWHIFAPTVNGHTYTEYMAQGNGGQLIIVLPQLDAVVLIMAGNYGNYPTWRTFYEQLLPRYLIAAMQQGR